MHVVHVGKFFPPAAGGIETHVHTLAKAQAAHGARVSVFCMNHEGARTVTERVGDVEVHRFGRLASAAKLDLVPGVVPALRNIDADVIHVQVPNPSMILACLAARPKAPIVVTYQSDHIAQRVRGALFRPVERRFYDNVKAIMPTSPTYGAGSDLLKSYQDRVEVVPMGIDLAPYLEPSDEVRREADAIIAKYPGPLWLGCGRLIYYKGFLTAIRALPYTEGTLLLVGDGPDRAGLEAEAERLGVRHRVVFLGALPFWKIVPYYHAAHAFWFPSNARSEAFGIVQLEAMASGCPVINTAIPASGVAWVSRHDETGLTVPMNDPVALAAAANRLHREKGLRARYASTGLARVRAEFDHNVMAERSLGIYARVVGQA